MIFRSVSNEASGCIAYLVGCEREGVAAVIDPARPDLEQWLALARARDLTITHTLDTHSFVRALMESIPPRPPSMDRIIAKNRGVLMLHRPAPVRLEPRDLGDRLSAGAVLVDTRDPRAFGAGHVAGSLNVWIDGPQFGERVAWFIPSGATLLVLVETEADAARAIAALARVGLDDVAGYVVGTVAVRAAGLPVGTLTNITVQELARRLAHERGLVVLDVREPAEWADGHMPVARHIPMRQVTERLSEIPRDHRIALVCGGGTRSSLVGSLLLARGFTDLVNVWGGMTGWAQAGLPTARD